MRHALSLDLLPDHLAVARLRAIDPLPAWALGGGGFASVTRRDAELSIVCADEQVPAGVPAHRNLRALQVRGPLAFDLVGVLAAIAVPLADAGVSLFALATYDTDVVLLEAGALDAAIQALELAGHAVSRVT